MSDEQTLRQYVIYSQCADMPDVPFVVRGFTIRPGVEPEPDRVFQSAATLNEARKLVPRGLVLMGRDPTDARSIVEVWL